MKPRAVPAFAVALAISLIAAPAAGAAFPGRNGDIALERFEAGNPLGNAVLSVRANGAMEARFGDGAFPAWSASGRWIAFSTGGITVAKATGASKREIVSSGYDPAWSEDGKSLVFVRDLEADEGAGFATLFRVNADGTKLKQLVQGRSPSWAPRGGRIAYASEDSVWLIQADGKRRERIARVGRFIVGLDWAPDAKSLIVVRQIEGKGEACEIVRISSSGRKLGTLLRADGITGAAYSPDGRSFVYSRGAADEASKRVYTRKLSGGKSGKVGQGSRPSWQPVKR
jgi:Tol biopolymer transport system component